MDFVFAVLAAALVAAVPAVPASGRGGEGGGAPAAPEEPAWEWSPSVLLPLRPSREADYVQPTLTADRGALHLEGRYNYEARNTDRPGSAGTCRSARN